MPSLDSLNHHFAIAGQLTFKAAPGNMQLAEIDNAYARATIALQGAHVMGFQPHGATPVLWLAAQAQLAAGKALRGGVPICWPWFGAHPERADLPAHGFARKLDWRVIASETLQDGSTRVAFELHKNEIVRAQWPYLCHLSCIVTVGRTLAVELVTENKGYTPLPLSEALHTYLAVGDVERVRVLGLENCRYFDKTDGATRTQQGPIEHISAEIDRVYQGTTAECVVEDPVLGRRIRIVKRGSQATVVWNPWAEKSAALDMGASEYRSMLCVESANALDSALTLAPGERHSLHAEYIPEPL